MNGDLWTVSRVPADDPGLVDRTGSGRLATVDPDSMEVRVSEGVSGPLLERVLVHEVGHCSMISYGLLPTVERFVRAGMQWEAEEWLCNYLADYGLDIMRAVREILGRAIYM